MSATLAPLPPVQPAAMTLAAYRDAVSTAMETRYGISWSDACGDDEPLVRAKAHSMTPEDFVRWWGDRYDLEPLAVTNGWW